MDELIFKRLKELSNSGKVSFIGDGGTSNSDQRIEDSIIHKEINFLLSGGFIRRINDNNYSLTEYGSSVSAFKSWNEYLSYLDIIQKRNIETEIFQNKLAKWQVRLFWVMFFFALLSLAYSTFDFIRNLNNGEYNPQQETQQKQIESEEFIPNNLPSDQQTPDSSSYPNS